MDTNSIYKSMRTKNASAMSIFYFISNIVYFPCSLSIPIFVMSFKRPVPLVSCPVISALKKINKHCIVTSGHFIVSKSCFVLKVMANIWNSISQNIFLHGALNLKTCKSLCFLDRL